MRRRAFLLHVGVAVGAMLAGCATIEDVRDARGRGVKRIFKQPYDEVFAAAQQAAAKRKLEVVSSDRDGGVLLLSNGASLGSLGERIAIFVARLKDRTTSVEIVARPVLGTVSFPPDWPSLLYGEIEEELTARRLRR